MNFKKTLVFRSAIVAVALSVTACGAESPPMEGDEHGAAEGGSNAAATAGEEAAAAETVRLTDPQRNAVRSANQYLSLSGFSRDGLIEQLSSAYGDGYDVADATVAVDSIDVNWNENAAKSARQYLSMTGFSCNGLIEQLSSSYGDKYTVEQATYGARQAGAC